MVPACRQAGRGVLTNMSVYFVYAIRSLKDGRIYVGMTCDLERRIKEHNQGKTPSTKFYRPWKLLYNANCTNRIEARKEEKKLKSGFGKEFLKSIAIKIN
jgi:putative endonuclease